MLLQTALCLVFASGAEWSVEVETSELTVWSRDNDATGLREIKARMFVDVTPERVWSVLADVEKHPSFIPHLLESRVVDREEAGAVFLYQRISPPLVDDRDYTVRVINDVDAEHATYKQTWTTANHRGPSACDAVRLKRVDGSWVVEPGPKGGAWINYWVHTTPGGSIPNWVVKAANRKGIPELMLAVKARVRQYASSR
ncbi:MAG: SRPBCC family protein [Myxococcota bacterium]|nr:SRPBCC family protein [Myxococcota bacterium]